ncbi:hypothetical protein [Alcaligenes sp. SDU_A2]|uniref:hypothetical protein n=1 Tax=Alcaligenes sp. SDU_A2 TaxID=3136634 RepID=UPI00311D8CB0
MKLLAGDFPKNIEFRAGDRAFLFGSGEKVSCLLFEEVEIIEVESEETKQAGGLAAAAVGGLTFGGAGAVVGALVGRNNQTTSVVRITFLDGRRLMAALPYEVVVDIKAALFGIEGKSLEERRLKMQARFKAVEQQKLKAAARKKWFNIAFAIFALIVAAYGISVKEKNAAKALESPSAAATK